MRRRRLSVPSRRPSSMRCATPCSPPSKRVRAGARAACRRSLRRRPPRPAGGLRNRGGSRVVADARRPAEHGQRAAAPGPADVAPDIWGGGDDPRGLRLLNEAFGHIAREYEPALASRLVSLLADAVGLDGLVTGQAEDVLATDATISFETLERIHRRKTGVLFQRLGHRRCPHGRWHRRRRRRADGVRQEPWPCLSGHRTTCST